MRTNFLPRNLTTGPPLSLPHITPWMHKHACAPHIAPSPGGARMALVPHCDTNQGRWRAPLSCKHQSFLVLFKCLPSLFLPSLTLAQPLPRFALHPNPVPPPPPHRLQPPLPPFSQVQVNPRRGEEGASRPEEVAEEGLSPGGRPVSQCMGLFPGPTRTISYSNVTIRPPTHGGLFMAAAPGRGVKMVI